MSWFGLGGGDEKKPDSSDSMMSSYDTSPAFEQQSSYAAPSSAGSFEQELAMEQHKLMIQGVVFKLTDLSFAKCVQKPSSTQLSYSDQSCIKAVVGKYLDTSELIIGQLSGKK